MSGIVQAQLIDYQENNKSLSRILDDVSKQHHVFFSYSSEIFLEQKISIEAEQLSMADFLEKLLKPYGFQAIKNSERFYVILPLRRKLSFTIIDLATQEPLPYATIHSLTSMRGAYASDRGQASMSINPAKDTVLLIRYLGYVEQRLSIVPNTKTDITVALKQDEVALQEVQIEYHNEAITLHEKAQFRLHPVNMKVLPGLPEADVLLSVQMLPGIESNDETASGINVRGGGKDEMLVYWDRIPIYQQAHFFGTLTSTVPSTVSQIDVYKNFIPTQFVGATSGLMEINLHDSVPERPQVVSNSNFTHADLMLRLAYKEKISLMLAGRLSYNNQFRSPTFLSQQRKLFSGRQQEDILNNLREDEPGSEDAQLSDLTTLSYNDLNAKLVCDISPKDYLSISALRNEDVYFFDAVSEDETALARRSHDISFSGFNAFFQRDWSNAINSNISVSRASFYLENSDEELFGEGMSRFENDINNSLQNTEIRFNTTFRNTEKSTFELGYQFNRYANFLGYEVRQDAVIEFSDTLEFEMNTHGTFFTYQYKIPNKLIVRPQIRLDLFPEREQTVVRPVLDIQYQLLPHVWVKGAYGHYVQATRSLREGELDVSNVSENIWLLADDDDLALLRSEQFSIGALYSNKGFLIDLDLYSKFTLGLNSLNQFSEGVEFEFADGTAETYGLDLMIKKKFRRYQTWLSYSLSRVQNTFEEIQDEPFYSSFDRPHQLRWVNNFYAAPFEFSLGWTYKSGTPYTEPEDLRLIVEPDDK